MVWQAFGAPKTPWRHWTAMAILALGFASCSSSQTISSGTETTGEIEMIGATTTAPGSAAEPETKIARQAGEPSPGRVAGSPADEAAPPNPLDDASLEGASPLVHVLGSIRSIGDQDADFSTGVLPVLNDLATIASIGCTPSECPATQVATWAEGTLEIVNVATRTAASEGNGQLEAYVGDLQRQGIAVIGYGATVEDAIRPIVFTNGTEQIAIFSLSLDPDNPAITATNAPGIAGVDSIGAVSDLVIANRNSGRKVVVLVDWGDSDSRSPTVEQTESISQIIDAGANAIVGHGSDFLQRFDVVNQTAVAYDLGNSSVTTTDPLRTDTAVLRIEFDASERSCLLPATAGPNGPALDLPNLATCEP